MGAVLKPLSESSYKSDVDHMGSSRNYGPFLVPNIVRHPYTEDPKRDPSSKAARKRCEMDLLSELYCMLRKLIHMQSSKSCLAVLGKIPETMSLR